MSIFLGTDWRTCVSCTRQLQRPLVTFLLILLTLSMTRYLGSGWLEGMSAIWILKLIMTCLCFLLALRTCRSTSISCQAHVLFSRPLVLLHFTPPPPPCSCSTFPFSAFVAFLRNFVFRRVLPHSVSSSRLHWSLLSLPIAFFPYDLHRVCVFASKLQVLLFWFSFRSFFLIAVVITFFFFCVEA